MEDQAMEAESHHAPESEFPHSPWVEIGAFASPQHSPPMPEYSGFDYGPSQLMAVDTSYGMSIPPPYASMPLPMPSHAWPSMLTTTNPFPESRLPVSTPTSASPSAPMPPIRKTSTGGSTPRRTLTDEDRRQMCIYHEENKTAKQTDIGALFGVERSTVSKVLRQKEKYLNPDDGTRSPIKRAKGRVPDIEKALSNWATKYQRQGHALNDEMIKEKALFFASTCGPEGKEKVCSTAWLEKFKHKNNLLGAKMRRGSTEIRSGSNSPTHLNTDFGSALQSPTGPSPTSPVDGFGSPLSPTSHEGIKRNMIELPGLTCGYQHGYSKSTTSLDTSSSAGMISPTSTLLSDSPFTPTSQSRLPAVNYSANSRPRSQTFPLVPIDPSLLSADETMDLQHRKSELQPSLSVATLESPIEMDEPKSLVCSPRQKNVIKRNRSNPEIKTNSMPPPSKSTTISPISSPGSPTQDEARRALELVINYFGHQPSGLAAQDYMTIGKLMERLDIAKNQPGFMLGGLPRIDEHEDIPIQRVTKKRSIHNLG
ncbi:DNA binding HTH domain Psq-type [Penicillium paradoxum]|uniref:DNA binding HTH domain Psq-type n=1 Tax=Penicillium paradoxum TaxID=176176 RepID=UPI0025489E55|nr:DNA binding HTH domain Psq-type [Penicillium paradoxum]KAJ5774363.1 DNA binding HTH domain Psq-type [Penicillium paradoxum]